jgi:hypothetical protein
VVKMREGVLVETWRDEEEVPSEVAEGTESIRSGGRWCNEICGVVVDA